MRKHRIFRIIKFATFAAVFVAVFGLVVMSLWNWLIPPVFGLRAINYWQAVGLLVLSKILFGGFRGGHGFHGYSRRRMIERLEKMTPEEREKFRQGLESRWGAFVSPPEPKQ
jgi:hypothetical protein